MLWDVCDFFMCLFGFLLDSRGIFTGFLWWLILVGPFLGFFVGFLSDFFMGFLCDVYRICVGFLWEFCGILMGSLWDFYGVFMVFCFWVAPNYRTNSEIAMASKHVCKIHSDRALFRWVLLPSCIF